MLCASTRSLASGGHRKRQGNCTPKGEMTLRGLGGGGVGGLNAHNKDLIRPI